MTTFIILTLALHAIIGSSAPTPDLLSRQNQVQVTNSEGLNWYREPNQGQGAPSDPAAYKCFGGDVASYPSADTWLSFDNLFELNRNTLNQANNIDQSIISTIHDAIVEVSQQSKINPAFVLAIVMQESHGKHDVQCTGNGNCGLMQASRGSISFNPSSPRDSIYRMIQDGVWGTSEAPGLVGYINDENLSWTKNNFAGNPFAAARVYNSGHVADSQNLDDVSSSPGTTKAYVNDVANRVVGWDGSNQGGVQAGCGLV